MAYTQSNPNQVALEGPASADASDQPIEAPVAVDYVNGQENASGGDAPFVSQNGKPVIVPASQGVLSQDFDPGGRTMTAEVEDTPDNGTVTVNSDGSFTYTPNNGFVGTDTFSYAVTNSADRYSTGTVAVDCYDPAPTAKSALYKLDNTGSVSTPAHTLDGDVVNPAGGSLSYRVATGGAPQHGTVTFNPDGSFAYTARSGFHGWDHFSYIANNGNADSNVAQVTLAPPNSPQPSESARAISQEASTEGVRASYNEAWSRLQALKMASLKYKEDVATFAASSNPNDEDGMNLVIADGDAMQTLFNSYMNQYNAVIRLVGEYTKESFFWQIDGDLVKDVNALPGDPFQIKLSQQQTQEFTSAAQAEGAGIGYWLDNTTNTIKTLETTHTVLTVISAAGGISAVGQKLIVSGLEVAAEQGACAAAQAVAKQVAANVVAGVTVNAVVQSATSKLANMLGLSPSTVQIIGDTFQLVCLLNAWRLERLATGCFVAGTEVLTMPEASSPSGYAQEPIQDVTVGQQVLTRDQNDPNAPLQEETVTALYQHSAYAIESVTIRDSSGNLETIQSTTEHPFYVNGATWTASNELAAGEQLIQPDGSLATVVSATTTAEPQGVTVYNFQVQNDHTYFVNEGAESVWVHNSCSLGHDADWKLRDSLGRFAGQGEESSGIDFKLPKGKRLSFPEQSWYGHTEGRTIAGLIDEGRLVAGSTLQIEGELAPCAQCRNIMKWASAQFQMDISYEDGDGNIWAWSNGDLTSSG